MEWQEQGLQLVAWGASDIGRARDRNNDAYAILPSEGLYIVADGLSGELAGDTASRMVCGIMQSELAGLRHRLASEGIRPETPQARQRVAAGMQQAFQSASRQIYERSLHDVSERGMATTAVVFMWIGSWAVIGHVGDSRLYLLRGQQIYRLTEDHTLLQKLLKQGTLTPEAAANFPHRNVLARTVGREPHVVADVTVIDIHPDDRFVLCTDGLTDQVPRKEMARVVSQSDPQTAVQQLITLANQAGGRDNATVIVIQARGQVSRQQRPRMRTEERAAYLQGVFLFEGLSFPELLRIMRVVREVRFPAGHVIVRENEPGDEFYVIGEGSVRVTRGGTELARIGTGGHFGELALVGSGQRAASVTAVTDCVLLAIGRNQLVDFLSYEPALGVKLLWRFLQNLGDQVRDLSSDLIRYKR